MRREDRVLALMADGTPRRAGEIASAIGAAKMSHLLATMVSAGRLRRISHGLYQQPSDVPHEDAETKGPPLRIQLLILIAALGLARSKDLTLLTGFGRHRNRGAGIANHLARLKARQFIEALREDGKHPFYRLTAQGIAVVRRLPNEWSIPEPRRVRVQLEEAWRLFSAESSARMRAANGRLQVVCDHIRDLLAQGPKSTSELIAQRPDLFTTTTTIHVALNALSATGEVMLVEKGRGSRPSKWARRLGVR